MELFRSPMQICKRQSQEKKAESYDKFTDILSLIFLGVGEQESKEHQRDGKYGNVRLEAEPRNEPGSYSCTNVCTHYDSDCLSQCQKASINKTDDHYRCR